MVKTKISGFWHGQAPMQTRLQKQLDTYMVSDMWKMPRYRWETWTLKVKCCRNGSSKNSRTIYNINKEALRSAFREVMIDKFFANRAKKHASHYIVKLYWNIHHDIGRAFDDKIERTLTGINGITIRKPEDLNEANIASVCDHFFELGRVKRKVYNMRNIIPIKRWDGRRWRWGENVSEKIVEIKLKKKTCQGKK